MSVHVKQLASRGCIALQWALLLSVFSYYFVENFVLSSGWEVVPLRSIDDYAMHESTRRMQEALLAGHVRNVLTCFDYGYGNIFWLANAILFLPLYFIDNAQLQIVLGRQVTLGFVFASVLVVGQIAEKMRPHARALKLPIMLTLACAPMFAIIGTKLHVNAPCMFFSVLAYHALIRDEVLDARGIRRVALFSGVAVGLKLTAFFVMPVIVATLLARLAAQREIHILKTMRAFGLRFGLIAAACTVPALVLFPFFIKDLSATYDIFQKYKNMGADFGGAVGPVASVADTLSYTLHPASFVVMAALFVVLARADWARQRWQGAILGLGILAAYAFVLFAVKKAPIYMATYALSVSPFMPLGLLGLSDIRISETLRNLLAWIIVLTGLLLLAGFRHDALSYHRFFEIARSPRVVTQLQALDGMKAAIGPLKPPLRVYLDSSTVFPATPFTKGVEVLYFYGNFRDHSEKTMGRFDYVAMNPEDYIFKMTPGSAQYASASESERSKADREEAARKRFRETGVLGNDRFKLIYEGHQALLYQRVQP